MKWRGFVNDIPYFTYQSTNKKQNRCVLKPCKSSYHEHQHERNMTSNLESSDDDKIKVVALCNCFN